MERNICKQAERQHRLLEAITLHAIEGNPLTKNDIEMFEMFEQEGWSEKRCREYIVQQLGVTSKASLAA